MVVRGASSRANGSVSTRHFHRFSFTRLNSIGSSRKSVKPACSHGILRDGRNAIRSRLGSYKIPYVMTRRSGDGRYASRGRLSCASRGKKKRKKRNVEGDELMLLLRSKLVHARSLYSSPPFPLLRWPTTRWTRGGKSTGFRRINLLILGFDCRPSDSRSPRREPMIPPLFRRVSRPPFFLHPSRVPSPKRILSSPIRDRHVIHVSVVPTNT